MLEADNERLIALLKKYGINDDPSQETKFDNDDTQKPKIGEYVLMEDVIERPELSLDEQAVAHREADEVVRNKLIKSGYDCSGWIINEEDNDNSGTTTASIKYNALDNYNIKNLSCDFIVSYVQDTVTEFYNKALDEDAKTMNIVNDHITTTTQLIKDIADNIEARSDVTNALFDTIICDISTLTDICDNLNTRMKFNESFSEKIIKEIYRMRIIGTIVYLILALIQIFDIYLF